MTEPNRDDNIPLIDLAGEQDHKTPTTPVIDLDTLGIHVEDAEIVDPSDDGEVMRQVAYRRPSNFDPESAARRHPDGSR